MTVQSLRSAISSRANELLAGKLVTAGIVQHKRNWRHCDCSWCRTKQEATVVIGSHVPRIPYRGVYCEDLRDAWRDEKRQEYRKRLSFLEGE